MNDLRRGFTMIELIFVIVIIGILAATAIPRLAATRDDAKLAICEHEVALFLEQISEYYTAQGQFSTITQMTNFNAPSTIQGFATDTNLSTAGNIATYVCDGVNVVDFNSSRIAVTVQANATPPTGVAALLNTRLAGKGFYKTYTIGGSSIKR